MMKRIDGVWKGFVFIFLWLEVSGYILRGFVLITASPMATKQHAVQEQ